MTACTACLRRGRLVALLSSALGRAMRPGGRRVPGVLALDEDVMIDALAGSTGGEVRAAMERFDGDEEAASLASAEVAAVCRHDRGYPRQLLALGDPPALLYLVGDPGVLTALDREPSVALVGTRRPSPYGLEVAYELGRGLGAAGVTVVSGLALGIDGTAHRGCLDARGPAVAVLAGGPDVPYPRTHLALYRRVTGTGVVVSELPPGTPPLRWAFPARNRIMAGLASMTVVVEAADPSGSLITSDFAGDLDRTVGAVPGRITSRVAAGPNRLIASGARVVTSPRDILDELFGVGAGVPAAADRAASEDPLTRTLLQAVEGGFAMDAICAATGLPAGAVRAALSRLEAEGRLVRDPLGSYSRAVAR